MGTRGREIVGVGVPEALTLLNRALEENLQLLLANAGR